MKRIHIIIGMMLLFSSCAKSLNVLAPDGYLAFQNEAVVLGYEKIIDDCNGGYMINILGQNLNNQVFIARSLPVGSDVDSGMVFPVKIVLNWEEKTTTCPDKRIITVSKLQRIY